MDQNMVEIYLAKYHEIQKYYIALDYLRSGVGCWINAERWESFQDEIKKALQKSVEETGIFINEFVANQVLEAEKGFKEAGVEIIRPNLRPWKAIAEKQVLEFEDKFWEKGLYDNVKAQQ